MLIQLLEDLADDLSDRLDGLHIILCLLVVDIKGGDLLAERFELLVQGVMLLYFLP